MKKFFTLFLLAFSLVTATRTMATTHMVLVADFSFNPPTFTANLGDTVMWMWANGSHTTTSTSVPTGAATWDHPITSSSTSFTYKPAVTGTYNYQCTPHASMNMVATFDVLSSTNVPAVNNVTSLTVAPNPSSGLMNIQTDLNNPSISVYDYAGRAVSMVHIIKNGSQMSLDVAQLPAGIYVLKLTTAEKSELQKIVVIH